MGGKSALMGLSIILIMLFHCGFCDFGNIGVDFFLILSGMGIYCSLAKQPTLMMFYHRRVVRLIPTSLMVTIPFAVYKYITGTVFYKAVIMGLALSSLFGDLHFWFIPLIFFATSFRYWFSNLLFVRLVLASRYW